MDLTPRIAVFDSGIGGTGVLAALRERAPWADIVYVADHAFGPYGERTLDEVRSRTEVLAAYLASAGCEVIVIACNSASAAALRHLRAVMPGTPFVGMEPAVKPAAKATQTGVVGVMATAATFQGELFRDLVGRHGEDVRIVEQPCPGLAAAIERGDDASGILDASLAPIIEAGADVVVLGCTHYPLIIDEIRSRLPAHVSIVDPAPAVARRTVDVARDAGTDLHGAGGSWWWSTAVEATAATERPWEAIDIPDDTRAAVRIGESTLTAVRGDITAMPVDAITNAANVELRHGGGVAAAIARAGGSVVDEESRAWVAEHGPLAPGVAALTSAGAMPARYVVHVAGPIHSEGQDNEALLATATLAALDLASEIEARSLAIPAISAGIYGYPPDEATAVIVETAAEYLSDAPTTLRSVRLVGYDEAMAARFAGAIATLDLEP